MRVKMSKQSPPPPAASAVCPCRTVIKIVGPLGTGSLPSTFAPPDHPLHGFEIIQSNFAQVLSFRSSSALETFVWVS